MPKNVICKKCNNLVNDWCKKVIDSPDQDMQRDCQHFCEKTNADRIRAMSDEELAEFIVRKVKDIHHQGMYEGALTAWFKWLKKPSE